MGEIVEDFLSNDKGKIIISTISGLGPALFRKFVRNCNNQGTRTQELENKIFQFENKCYIYDSMATKCQK